MTRASALIEVRFAGEDVQPETVKAGDVAEMIQAVEKMVESSVTRDHPEIKRDQVIVGFVEIQSTSLTLKFSSLLPDVTMSAFQTIGDAIATNQFSQLPTSSLDGLDTIASFTRRRHCTTDFALLNGGRKVLVTMTPEIQITRLPLLAGDTTIYGQVVRVGGREPRVMVETVDGQTLYCDASVEIAKDLGERLYRTVGLFGLANWDAQTYTIEKFSIKGVTPYEGQPITEAMEELAKLVGSYYADVGDVERYIASIRGAALESEPQ